MLKKVCSYVFILFILMSFAGCSGSGEEYLTPDEIAMQQSNDIMAALANNDKAVFKEFLCSGLQEEHSNLDSEIDGLFNFIDGDIISYDVDFPAARGGYIDDLEGWVEEKITTRILDIKTSNGESYEIYYSFYTKYKEHPEKLGITFFHIKKSDATYDTETGYSPDESYIIEYMD